MIRAPEASGGSTTMGGAAASRADVLWRHLEIWGRRYFPVFQWLADAAAWALALYGTTFLRYDLRTEPINERGVVVIALIAAITQLAVGLAFGLYRRRFHYGSFDEMRVLAPAVAVVSMVLFVVARLDGGAMVPRSVPLAGAFVALVIASVVRFVCRLVEDRQLRPSEDGSVPILVVGAGRVGTQIVRVLLRTPDSPYRPVALLDDDPQKTRLQVGGLRVCGTANDSVAVSRRLGAKSVLIAIPSLTNRRLQEIVAPITDAGLQVLLPPPAANVYGDVDARSVRPLTAVDLLGRRPADVDLASIAGYITGRRVLVTGAGGSIGSELCRQLHAFQPASLVMLDRDESGLHAAQLSIEGRALLDSPNLVLADIRDRDRLFDVFQQHRPQVVFHAAALKHMPLLEFNPAEAWKTNIVGTNNVLEAAEAVGVDRLVNVSTDKAADPANVLGFTKRICERMTAAVAAATGKPYVSVRFGNVLGSRGSMLGVFQQQIAAGGPVTVTHPEVSRYFMTIEEAVALTIQAGALGSGREALVLDMGDPIKIVEVVRQLADEAGADIEIVFTGLRPGEKLHEVLLGAGEADRRPHHRLISHVDVPPLSFEAARATCSVDGRMLITQAALEAASAAGITEDGFSLRGEARMTRSASG